MAALSLQAALYQVSVRWVRYLPLTSFRFRVTTDTLVSLARRFPLLGLVRDLHPLDNTHASQTKIKVAECPRSEGYIKRKSYNGLCCMPTEVGGSPTTYYCDYFYTNANTSKGLRVRAAGGSAGNGTIAGASYTSTYYAAAATNACYSSPLCYFESDPIIEQAA